MKISIRSGFEVIGSYIKPYRFVSIEFSQQEMEFVEATDREAFLDLLKIIKKEINK